jgi:hypothetical protein
MIRSRHIVAAAGNHPILSNSLTRGPLCPFEVDVSEELLRVGDLGAGGAAETSGGLIRR